MSRSILVFPLVILIGLLCLIIPHGINCDADATRASYGVVLKIIDQPYFPTNGKWTGFINITVRNLHTEKSDTFSLECKEKPDDWDVMVLEPTIEVGTSAPTGPEKTTTILVSCPKMETKGIYTVKIKATSQGDPEQYHTVYIDLEVMLVPLVRVEGPVNVQDTDIDPANGIPDYREGDPGGYATYDFRIRNTGNGEEAYFISLESPNNWWHEMQGPSFTETLDINQTTIKRVKIQIPHNAEMGDSDVLKFIATSQSNSEIYHIGTIETLVKQIYLVDLEAPIYTTYSYPLQEVEIDFNVTNKGNGEDDTIRIEMKYIPKGWSYEFGLSRIGDAGIPRYGKAPCVLSLVVPGSALNMTYSVTFEAYTSLKNIPDSTITFNVTIFQKFSLNLTKGGEIKKVLPGDDFSYSFEVENAGNGEDTFNFDLVKVGANDIFTSWYGLNTDTVVLGDKLSVDMFLTIKVPKLTKAGEYYVGVEVTSLKAEEMQLIVMEVITFQFEVKKQYSLDVAINKGEELVVINSDEPSLDDRGGILHFNVTNTGNTQDIVLFEVDYPKEGGWTSPDFMISRALLQYRESRGNLILNVKAPLKIPLGLYHFTLRIKSDKDPSDDPASDSVDFAVKIVRYDLALNATLQMNSISMDTQENITVDHHFNVVFTIRVKNVGNLDIERFNTSLYLNEEKGIPYKTIKISNFTTGMEKELLFDFTPSNYGTYTLIFSTDSDMTISEMNENNNRIELTYISTEPTIDLIEGSTERSIELFGDAYSLLEFILLILIIIALLLAVAVVFLRVGRKKKKKVLVDTGLVDSGEYRFKERAPTVKFDRSEFDDSFEDMYDEIEEEDGSEEIKKDKETGYFVAERDSAAVERTGTGFTVLEESAEPYQTPYPSEEEFGEWDAHPSEEEYGEWDAHPSEGENWEEEEGMFMGGAEEQPMYEADVKMPSYGEALPMGAEKEFLLPEERMETSTTAALDGIDTREMFMEDDDHRDEVDKRAGEEKEKEKRMLKEIFSTAPEKITDTVETYDRAGEIEPAKEELVILTKPPTSTFMRTSEKIPEKPVMMKTASDKTAMKPAMKPVMKPRPDSQKPVVEPRTESPEPSMKPAMKPKTESLKAVMKPAMEPRTESQKPSMKAAMEPKTESLKPAMKSAMEPRTESQKSSMKPAMEPKTESLKPAMKPVMTKPVSTRSAMEQGTTFIKPISKPKTESLKPAMKPVMKPKTESIKPSMKPAMKPKTESFKPSMKPVMKPKTESFKPSMRPVMKPVVKPKNEKE